MKGIHSISFATLLTLASGFCGPNVTFASSVGSVDVMEIDEVRDAATVARVKARKRSEDADSDESSSGYSSSGGCADMNIGNVKTGVGQPVPRNVTIVIEGPVVQENKCR